MSLKLLDKILEDERFHCDQCPDGSWDIWFNDNGPFCFCENCGKPQEDKILSGVFRDTKEFDNAINKLLNRGK